MINSTKKWLLMKSSGIVLVPLTIWFILNFVSIYDNDYHSHNIDSNYIVSRAFKKLPELMRISREIATKSHKLIVLKGKSAQEELNNLSKDLNYKYRLETSLTNKDSKVLIVNISK